MADPTVKVLLFATLRQVAGGATVELPLGGETPVEVCWEELCRRHPGLSHWRGSVRPALNQRYVDWLEVVRPGDELAFLPPVSGGAGGRVVSVVVGAEEIDLGAMHQQLDRHGVGAIASFLGVVRDPDQGRSVPHLDYEAYLEMARLELGRIAAEAASAEGVAEVLVHHRTGRVERGAASVAVVVGAAHRHQALDACTYVIDELKARAPIWKVGV